MQPYARQACTGHGKHVFQQDANTHMQNVASMQSESTTCPTCPEGSIIWFKQCGGIADCEGAWWSSNDHIDPQTLTVNQHLNQHQAGFDDLLSFHLSTASAWVPAVASFSVHAASSDGSTIVARERQKLDWLYFALHMSESRHRRKKETYGSVSRGRSLRLLPKPNPLGPVGRRPGQEG